jgi:hypothetical protein
MTRFTGLTSVLESLESPAQWSSRPGDATREARSRRFAEPPRAGLADAEAAYAPKPDDERQPGQEIWESARRQADFYCTYAEMLEEGSTAQDQGTAWVAEVYRPGHWAGPATLASAYRLAAQHAALVDPRWATRLAVRAAMAYVAAGLPFGLFLLTGVVDDRTLRDSAVFGDVVAPFQSPDNGPALRHPAQQAYLLLSAASRPWLRGPLERTLRGVRERLAVHSLRPIGPQKVPLGDYLDLADAMNYDERAGYMSREGQVRYLAQHLAGLHRGQAATLRAAQRNRYLWRTGASPVNVIDFEHVAMSGLALRNRRWFGELSEAITTELSRDDPLAELPLWTMGEIEAELPAIAPTVIDIIREPGRPRFTEDFRDEDATVPPWQPGSAEWTRQTRRTRTEQARDDRTRVDRPALGGPVEDRPPQGRRPGPATAGDARTRPLPFPPADRDLPVSPGDDETSPEPDDGGDSQYPDRR